VYQKNELGNVPVTGAQLYTSSTTAAGTEYNPPVAGIRFMQFGGSTKYAVFVATTGIMGAVTACNAVTTTTSTTTTTTTPAPTTTTTTTTSSTTTTTTLQGVGFGVSITTKYGTDFLACNGTVTGLRYQKAEFGNTPTNGAQLYTSSTTGAGTEWTPAEGAGLYLFQFGGSTKWSVFVGASGIIGSVSNCSGVSTTTTSSTTTTTTLPITSTTTTSTTTTTTTAAPTFVYNVNQGEVSAFAACFSSTINTYIWSFSGTFASGTTYYLGTSTAPSQPIQAFDGNNLYYSYEGFVITIATNGAGGDYQPCPTTTTTIPPTEYSQFLDCSGNDWYAFSFINQDGTSSDVPDNCVFYQGSTFTPVGTQFTNFFPDSGCFCP
jgi:hypothetical protein